MARRPSTRTSAAVARHGGQGLPGSSPEARKTLSLSWCRLILTASRCGASKTGFSPTRSAWPRRSSSAQPTAGQDRPPRTQEGERGRPCTQASALVLRPSRADTKLQPTARERGNRDASGGRPPDPAVCPPGHHCFPRTNSSVMAGMYVPGDSPSDTSKPHDSHFWACSIVTRARPSAVAGAALSPTSFLARRYARWLAVLADEDGCCFPPAGWLGRPAGAGSGPPRRRCSSADQVPGGWRWCGRGGTGRRACRWTRPTPAAARTGRRPAARPGDTAGWPVRPGRDHPVGGQVPPLYLAVAQARVGRVDQVEVGALPGITPAARTDRGRSHRCSRMSSAAGRTPA